MDAVFRAKSFSSVKIFLKKFLKFFSKKNLGQKSMDSKSKRKLEIVMSDKYELLAILEEGAELTPEKFRMIIGLSESGYHDISMDRDGEIYATRERSSIVGESADVE